MQWTMAICDMNRVKLCELYDSELMPEGQAYDVSLTTEMSGWKELTFSIAKTVDGKQNFRWNYIRSGYQVRVVRNGVTDWFLQSTPKLSHKGQSVTATVTCGHVCSLLNKKNLYLTFDDENGIGTAQHFMKQILKNTGWSLGMCETFYEADGTTEKIRSYSSEGKRGAYLLITDICKLFAAYPVYHGDTRTIDILSLNRHESLLELNFGKNLTSIDRKEDADEIVTRQYVEGEYTDDGYVGIDSANPTGLSFLLNFDYYRSLGLFTQTHEEALSTYLTDLKSAKAVASAAAVLLNQKDARLNELWGQVDLVLYVVSSTAVSRCILGGDADSSDTPILDTDNIVVLTSDDKYHTQTGGAFAANVQYAIKFVSPSSALIGGKEVAVEAKQKTISRLEEEKERELSDEKRRAIDEQIIALQEEINDLYNGNASGSGLYALMREAAVTMVERDDVNGSLTSALNTQEAVEEAFAIAMGDMLRDGYWSDTSYVIGQEELLYLNACEIMAELSKPKVSYTLSVQNLCGISGYEQEVFQPNMAVRIWDEALSLNDHAYVTKLKEFPATPEKDSITISNDVTQIGSTSLDSIISQITGIAEDLNQKKSLYDRSKAITEGGSIPAKRLEGMIDVLKTRLSSSTSNWYTDASGNIVMESLDGKSAMQLCGSGFMIASSKTNTGQWDWRTFGTGEGFTADMIIAGFLSADRIESHSITVNKLASDVGASLDLSSNIGINQRVSKVYSDMDTLVGYRMEIISSSDILSSDIQKTTLSARVWHGSTNVTDTIAESRFNWKRVSSDSTADALWNNTHQGTKSITITVQDVAYSATYSCELSDA